MKPFRRHADNSPGDAIEPDAFSDDARVASETAVPKAICDYGHVGTAGAIFVRGEYTAQQRRGSVQRKNAGSGANNGYPLGIAVLRAALGQCGNAVIQCEPSIESVVNPCDVEILSR